MSIQIAVVDDEIDKICSHIRYQQDCQKRSREEIQATVKIIRSTAIGDRLVDVHAYISFVILTYISPPSF